MGLNLRNLYDCNPGRQTSIVPHKVWDVTNTVNKHVSSFTSKSRDEEAGDNYLSVHITSNVKEMFFVYLFKKLQSKCN